MKQILKLFLILGIALPSAVFGMENIANNPLFQKIAAANNRDQDGDGSGESSLNTSIIASPRHEDAKNLDRANAAAQFAAHSNATAANNALVDIANTFLNKAARNAKTPQADIHNAQGTPPAVEDDEWGDLANFDAPTDTPAAQPVDLEAVWNSTHEKPAPEAPPFPDNISNDNNNPTQNEPIESPRPLPEKPTAPELGHQIPEEYVAAPAPTYRAKRPLPPAPKNPSINNSNHAKYIDEEPIIEIIPDENDYPKKNDDAEPLFLDDAMPDSRGVLEEINRTIPAKKHRNVRFAPQDREKHYNPDNPADQVNQQDSIIKPAKPAADANPGSKAQPAKPNLDTTSISATAPSSINLLVSAGIFGVLSWLENNMAKKDPNSFKATLAKEFASGAQQAAGANIAQQLFCKKPANTFAFTATFAILHACEVGLKKLTTSVLGKTIAGKRISTAYSKLPKNKRKMIDGIGMLTAWTIKTLLAKAITN